MLSPDFSEKEKKEGYRDCIAAPKKMNQNGRAHEVQKGLGVFVGLGSRDKDVRNAITVYCTAADAKCRGNVECS
jgi:hypothetical protein